MIYISIQNNPTYAPLSKQYLFMLTLWYRYLFFILYAFSMFYCWEHKTWKNEKAERNKKITEGIEEQKGKKSTPIWLYSWDPCKHKLGLEGPGPQPKNCGSAQWMTAAFKIHKEQWELSELHLRKCLGTGQGPLAEGSCHWGAQSHQCTSVQRPCESAANSQEIHNKK